MPQDPDRYEHDYSANLGFENELVAYRRRILVERLRVHAPSVVLEIGCGPDLSYRHFLREAAPVDRWLVVEAVNAWCESARAARLPGLAAIEGFFEDSIEKVRSELGCSPDVVICSGVVPEVPSVAALLGAIKSVMGPGTVLHITSPNARSFHRRLGVSMNLIAQVDALGERNVLQQQLRVLDAEGLEAELRAAGLEVVHRGGHFMKPFTNAQMLAIQGILGETVMEGLFRLGREYPEWAAELFYEARLPG